MSDAATFELSATSLTYANADPLSVAINFEGAASSFGTVLGTFTATGPNQTSGDWEWIGVSFPDEGDSLTATGMGQFEKVAADRWVTKGLLQISDSRQIDLDGEFNLSARTWSGGLTER